MKLESVDKHLKEKLKDPYFKELYELEEQKLGIVKHVIDYRIKHDLNQKALADRIGVTQQHISKIESGAVVTARITDTATVWTSGAVEVSATGANAAYAEALGRSEGFINAAVLLAEATIDGAVWADLSGAVSGAGDVTVAASGSNAVSSVTEAAALGALAGSFSGSLATISNLANVEATAVGGGTLTMDGALTLGAAGANSATASSDAGTSEGLFGFSGSGIGARIQGGVRAELARDVSGATDVTVQASGSNAALATAQAISRSNIVAGSGAFAEAEVGTAADVVARVAAGVELDASGALLVRAQGANSAVASAEGGVNSLIAVAAMLPTATIHGAVLAEFGATMTGQAASLAVKAEGSNSAAAITEVQSISVVGGAGAVALANIASGADVIAQVLGAATVWTSGLVAVEASGANSAQATALGESGGTIVTAAVMISDASVEGAVLANFAGDATMAGAVTVSAVGSNTALTVTEAEGMAAFAASLGAVKF